MSVKFSNPFRRQFVEAATGDPVAGGGFKSRNASAAGTIRTSSREPMVNSQGIVNASSDKELMANIMHLLRARREGAIVAQVNQDNETREAVVEQMRKASADKTGAEFVRLGEMFGDSVYTYGSRNGIARNCLLIKEPKTLEEAKIKVYRKQVSVYVATGPSAVQPSFCELDYVYPPEYELKCLVLFEMKHLAFSGAEFMDEKLADGLESHMVAEDRLFRAMSVSSSSIENSPVGFNTFNPATLVQLYRQPRDWGLTVTGIYLANDLWPELMTNTDFVGWWDPAVQHELILEGQIGKMLGATINTDGYRDLRLQVLQPGEIFFYADPAHLGGLVQREEVTAHEVNRFASGESMRGWFVRQLQGMAIGNPRGVSYGYRL